MNTTPALAPVTLTNRAAILAFAREQSKLNIKDRTRFSATLKPITDPVWLSNSAIVDACFDEIEPTILADLVVGRTFEFGIFDNVSSMDNMSTILYSNLDNCERDHRRMIDLNATHFVSLTYTPRPPPRRISSAKPATRAFRGLQYEIEITDDGTGVRGFKAGCNRVQNSEAIEVLHHLANGLGYTVTINDAVTKVEKKPPILKPAPKKVTKKITKVTKKI